MSLFSAFFLHILSYDSALQLYTVYTHQSPISTSDHSFPARTIQASHTHTHYEAISWGLVTRVHFAAQGPYCRLQPALLPPNPF